MSATGAPGTEPPPPHLRPTEDTTEDTTGDPVGAPVGDSGPPRLLTAEPLATARLLLEPLRLAHAEEMAVVLSDPALYAFTGGSPEDAAALRARYARVLAGAPEPGVSWCNWVLRLRSDGRLAGYVQATVVPGNAPGAGTAEVAWVVGRPWQGRGLAAEAARALVADLLGRPEVTAVVAHVHPGHAASAAVARAAGLTPTAERQGGEVKWLRVREP
ncbi:acetyltransferase [Streptomyces longispororuber]|uniref:Acetyltransferase n=1 Tax=Streptomyces longispororuber TaxID=68230 RepID=A0A919DHE4_9ACTN|nr:GNAT family N-acetyltransferase [Streptomyces longispororuber]GHE42494.1 acetyltransferase [Streptomyces longispororuber]